MIARARVVATVHGRVVLLDVALGWMWWASLVPGRTRSWRWATPTTAGARRPRHEHGATAGGQRRRPRDRRSAPPTSRRAHRPQSARRWRPAGRSTATRSTGPRPGPLIERATATWSRSRCAQRGRRRRRHAALARGRRAQRRGRRRRRDPGRRRCRARSFTYRFVAEQRRHVLVPLAPGVARAGRGGLFGRWSSSPAGPHAGRGRRRSRVRPHATTACRTVNGRDGRADRRVPARRPRCASAWSTPTTARCGSGRPARRTGCSPSTARDVHEPDRRARRGGRA